jgi:carbonic anhydrase
MSSMNADEALQELLAGNRRYVAGQLDRPHQTKDRRLHLVSHQEPFAVILSCADSRLPPEIIFDQGLGDLFVIRIAGNLIDEAILGSIEYAVHHLQTSLLVVLGHKGCGTVKATLDALAAGEGGAGNMRFLVSAIQPAVAEARIQPGDLLDNAVRINVKRVVRQLSYASPILSASLRAGKLKIVGAYYDLESGQVDIITGETQDAQRKSGD